MAEPTKAANDAAEASSGLPQFAFDTWAGQIFWLVLIFGLLYFILAKFILPRLEDGMSERRDRVADDLDSAEKMQKQAVQAEKDYENAMADARAKAHNISDATRKSVEAEIEKEIETAEIEFAKKQAEADKRIGQIKTKALAQIDNIAGDAVSAIIAEVSNVKISDKLISAAITKAKE